MAHQAPDILNQIHSLRTLRTDCLNCRAEFEQLTAEAAALKQDTQRVGETAERECQTRTKMLQERSSAAARKQREQLAEEFELNQTELERQLEQQLVDLQEQLETDVHEHEKRLESELWVLQSVCDEGNDDSPVAMLERTRDTFATQEVMLTERFTSLQENSDRTTDFMKSCHAAPDDELPPPDIHPRPLEESRGQVIEQIDLAITQISGISRLKLPYWVHGWRPVLVWGLLFLVVTSVATGIRVDLRTLINADVARPDWQWVGTSAVIGLVSSAFFTTILLVIAQQKLRGRFADVLQHTANARAAEKHWLKLKEREVRRQERAAEEWQSAMLKEREARVSRMKDATQQRIDSLRHEYADEVSDLQTQSRNQLAECQANHEASLLEVRRESEAQLARDEAALHSQLHSTLQSAEESLKERMSEISSSLEVTVERWRAAQEQLQKLSQDSRDASAGQKRWPDAGGGTWKPSVDLPSVISVGDFLSTVPTLDRQSEDRIVNTCIDFPAVLRFPEGMSLLVEHDSAGREPALQFVSTVLLKLLTTIPPGRLQFTLIDPVGLGQSFSAMMHLADYDELLISNRIWTDAAQIREQLQKVTEHMQNVFQTYLRSEYETIEQYNAAAGEVAEPYHFVVVAGFPDGFTEESARHLTSILTSGPRCGVYPVILRMSSQPLPRSFDGEDLTNHCTTFSVSGAQACPVAGGEVVTPQTGIEYELLPPPVSNDYVSIVRQVGEVSRDARRVEVSFTRIAPRTDAVWSHSTAAGIDLPIGRAGAARLQYMRLGKGTSQHVLIAGKTGSGKSTLLHIVITNLAMHYSPNEIQFYLIDFKKGVEFRTYAANHLPHARVIAIESDREFGLSVLERLDEVLQERGELFRTRGVQDVPAFRRACPEEPMPRLLLLIDEFQEFFVAEDRVSSRAALLLDRLIRQGRAFGIHVVLGSQTLGGAYSLARSTLGQVAVRIALQCSESDAHLILSEDNAAARLLSRPGEAIYNDANGLLEGNHPFQIAWLDEEHRESLIEQLRSRRVQPAAQDRRMVVFEGNVAPSLELCHEFHTWLTVPIAEQPVEVASPEIWLGEPVAIAPTTRVSLRNAGGQNLLIVGQESDMADSLLLMCLLSMIRLQVRADSDGVCPAVHLLHDGRDRESVSAFETAIPAALRDRCVIQSGPNVDEIIAKTHARLLERETVTEGSDHDSGAGRHPKHRPVPQPAKRRR